MTTFLVILFLAIAYRLRGTGRFLKFTKKPKGGTFARRLFWSACVAISVVALILTAYGPVWQAAGIFAAHAAVGAFLGLLIPHGEFFDMGRIDRKPWRDGLAMITIGAARMALVVLPLMVRQDFSPLLGGLLIGGFGVCHMLAYLFGRQAYLNGLTDDPIAVAEPLAGAYFAATLAAVIAHLG